MAQQKIKWFPVSSRGRNIAILYIDSVILANAKGYSKLIYDSDYKLSSYRQFDGKRWIGQDDRLNIIKIFKSKNTNRPSYIYEIGSNIETKGKELISLVKQYKNRQWETASNNDLADILTNLMECVAKMWGGPMSYSYYFFLNDIFLLKFKDSLQKKLKNNFQKVWHYLETPQMSAIAVEHLSLLKLAEKKFKGDLTNEDIFHHFQKFAHLKKHYFWGQGYTLEEIKKRLEDLIAKGSEAIKSEIKLLEKTPTLDKKVLPKKDRLIIEGVRKWTHSVDFADEATNYFTYHLRPFFKEIARRLGISYENLVSMTILEIEKSFQQKKSLISKKDLVKRYQDHAFLFTNNKTEILIGEELKKYRHQELSKIETYNYGNFKGVVAFAGGIIRGKAKIIQSEEKLINFQPKEILVTQMTNPTYVPAMKKAAAIITDEGGLLCHAAIVSRELKIPCIIGTKIATKVLHDGDLVEVDANEGMVRILKRTK